MFFFLSMPILFIAIHEKYMLLVENGSLLSRNVIKEIL